MADPAPAKTLPLELVFVSSSDPLDIRSFSGVLVHMVDALRRQFPDMEIVGNARADWFPKLQRRIRRATVGRSDPYHWRWLNRLFAARLARRWRGRRVVVISVVNATLAAELALHVPVINVTDSTFELMRSFYAAFDQFGDRAARAGERAERESIVRAVHNSVSSDWCARSAIDHYGARAADVSVISWGCNLPWVPAEQARYDGDDVCRLLFIGGDWTRKGGDVALETFCLLKARGLPVTLDLVGARPGDESDTGEGITAYGFLSKQKPADSETILRLNREASFLFLPTRQDCTPMVFAEANAFGTPAITRDVGGVGSVVEDGVSGYALPADAGAADFADRIEALWRDPAGYQELRRTARRTYETRLNWDVWVTAMKQVIDGLVNEGRI